MTWRVARSLDVLLDEVNAAAPARSKVSDGSIGDAAHATRTSDHNPWVKRDGVGIVRARDFTHDPAGGLDAHALAETIRRLGLRGHPALGDGAYVISNRRIASDTYGWAWRPYAGSNPHTAHSHVSVSLHPAGFDSTAPWGITGNEEDDMTDEDRKLLRETLTEVRQLRRETTEGHRKLLRRLNPGGAIRDKLNRLIKQGRATRGELEDLAADIDTEESDR